jgi:tetratricopeptide (TPR) repeat protein
VGVVFFVALVAVAALAEGRDGAQTGASGATLNLAIIVVPTRQDAEAALKRLSAGMDFGVLAKEISIDATAVDGGYMGALDPKELRSELRDALGRYSVGQVTDIIQLPSGFAILKILAAPPVSTDLNPERILALISRGQIRFGAAVSGQVEANAIMQDFPKPAGWDRDLREVCKLRTESLTNAENGLRGVLQAAGPPEDHDAGLDRVNGHSALGQLLAYRGEMDQSIEEWKIAYKIAEDWTPKLLPNLEESLGTALLHASEMENGVYRSPSDLDIFPPLNPHASFTQTGKSEQAIEYYRKYLDQEPDDLEVRWLLNLAYMTIGQYPAGVPKQYLIPPSDFQSKESIGRFKDVAPAAGLNVVRAAGGVIVDDFENNGLLDIVVSSQNVCDPLRYFHNNGDGTFEDRSAQAGLADQLGGLNIVQADYNNDGCMDILVLRGGWEYPQRKSLLRNNCNGTFTDVTDASGLGATVTSTQSAAWADIDNDGYLDLFIANENSPAQLFHNNGDGTFREIGEAAGIDRTAFSKGVAAADYDNDGFVDFYVTNQNGVNFLYHNKGDGTFTEVGRQAGVQAPSFSFATWFFDYDNDGWPDLFVADYLNSIDETLKTYVGGAYNAETLRLYRNRHDGTFEDVTTKVGLDKIFMPMGANFGDVDDDGYLDIYLGSGSPSYTALLPHVLLLNKAGKTFVDITQSSGTGELHKGHGIAFADLSRNGHEDIVAETGGAVPGDEHAMRVFQNPGNNNDWLNVRLVGVRSNREAAGAQIKVTVQNGVDAPRSLYRVVGETSSFGANPMEQHIGLGPRAHAVAVDIWWPASNTRQHFAVEKNQFIQIKEFATSYVRLDRAPVRLGGAKAAFGNDAHSARQLNSESRDEESSH